MPAWRPLVILPTYDEVANLPTLVPAILEVDPRIEVLVVDDGSPDGTAAWVREAGANEPRLHLLARDAKLGLGSAYRAGWHWALGRDHDPVVTMDADQSHPPSALPSMFALLEGGADLAIGSRYVPGGGVSDWGLHRRVLSRTANFVARLVLRLPARDATAGYRAFRAHVLRTIGPDHIKAEGYSFLEETLWRVHQAGFEVAETPIEFRERRRGRSKISRTEIVKAMGTLLRLRFSGSQPRSPKSH